MPLLEENTNARVSSKLEVSDGETLPDRPLFELEKRGNPLAKAEFSAGEIATYAAPAAIAGLSDTILDMFLDDNATADFFTKLGMDEFSKFYKANEDPAKFVGETLGLFAIGGGAISVGRAVFPKLLKQSTTLSGVPLLNAAVNTKRSAAIARRLGQYDRLLARTGATSLQSDAKRRQISRALVGAKVANAAVEGVVAEAAIFGALNQSDIFYPEDFTLANHLAFASLGPLIGGGVAYLHAKRLVNKSGQQVAREAKRALNPEDFDIATLGGTIPGTADYQLTATFDFRNSLKPIMDGNIKMPDANTIFASGVDPVTLQQKLRSNVNALLVDVDTRISSQIGKIATQTHLRDGTRLKKGTLTANPKIGPKDNAGVYQNILAEAQSNPFSMLGVYGIDVAENANSVLPKLQHEISGTKSRINKLRAEILKKQDEGADAAKEIAEIEKLERHQRELELSEIIVWENDGSFSLISKDHDRKARFTDGDPSAEVNRVRASGVEDGFYNAQITSPSGLITVSVDDAGRISHNIKMQSKATSRSVKEIERGAVTTLSNERNQILNQITAAWDPRKGPLYNSLESQMIDKYGRNGVDILTELSKWRDSAKSSLIRDWFAADTDEAQILYSEFAPFRNSLHELSDDGTITLYRGESAAETAAIKNGNLDEVNDVVSMTSDPKVALGFMGSEELAYKLIEKKVPIEDIIVPVGGLSREQSGFTINEAEFIVKRNKSRVYDDALKNSDLFDMDLMYRSAMFAALERSVKEIAGKPLRHSLTKGVIPQNANWARLQWLQRLQEADPDFIFNNFTLPANFVTPRQLQYEILMRKYEDYKQLHDRFIQGPLQGDSAMAINLPSGVKYSPEDIAYMVDIPAYHAGTSQPSPIIQLFNDMKAQGVGSAAELRQILRHMDEVDTVLAKQIVRATKGENLEKIAEATFEYTGNAMNVRTFRDGSKAEQPMRPAVMLKHNVSPEMGSRDQVLINIAQAQASAVDDFLKYANRSDTKNFTQEGAFVGEIMRFLADPELDGSFNAIAAAAKDVEELIEFERLFGGLTQQRSHQYTHNKAMQAAIQIDNILTKRAEEMIAANYRQTFIGQRGQEVSFYNAVSKIQSNANKASAIGYNSFRQSRQVGWDLAPRAVRDEQGRWVFPLAEGSNTNAKLWDDIFGDALPENALMPNINAPLQGNRPTIIPAALDDIGLDFAEAVRSIGHVALDNSNIVRKHLRLPPLNKKEWWAPPINFASAKPGTIAYIHVPGERGLRPIRANSKTELDKLVEENIKLIDPDGSKLANKIDPQTFERFHELQDEAFESMVDFGDPLRQTGASRGRSAKQQLDLGDQIGDIVDSLTKQFTSVARRTRGIYFEPQISYVKSLMRVNNAPPGTRSIFSDYLTTIYGGSNFQRDGVLGRLYSTIDEAYDETLTNLFNRVKEYAADNSTWLLARSTSNSQKLYDDIRTKFGPYTPFVDAVDFAERTTRIAPPVELKKHMAALNAFTSTMTLRLFEVGHAILNMLGLATTSPAVLRALNKQTSETRDEWITRIGAFGAVIGDDVPVFHPAKLMTSAGQFMFTDEGRTAWKKAKELGYFKQQVSEIIETLIRPHESLNAARLRRATDFASKLSDKSEELARALAHMQGYYLAKNAFKMESETIAHAYANKFANEIIGDYNPANKPQIFQGSVGMPLGLFQTYMWNYFHRLFGYVGNQQWRALATQYAMQASIFGGQSVPGFNQFSEMFASNFDGSSNPVDNLRARFGPEVSDFLLYGALTQLTQMGFNTRGDSNVRRVPNLIQMSEAPSFQMMGDMMTIIHETARQFFKGGQYSNQQQMEIIGTHFTNRPLRNLFEVFAGNAVDKRGQIIEEDTRSGLGIAARILGAKPLVTQKTQETNYRLKSTEWSRRAMKDRLRDTLRPKLRSGNYDADDISGAFITYVESGGSPEHFGQALRDMFVTANMGLAPQKFLDLLGKKTINNDLARFMNMGILEPGDPEFD